MTHHQAGDPKFVESSVKVRARSGSGLSSGVSGLDRVSSASSLSMSSSHFNPAGQLGMGGGGGAGMGMGMPQNHAAGPGSVQSQVLTLDNCRTRREGFGGPEINGSVNIPPSIVKSLPGGF